SGSVCPRPFGYCSVTTTGAPRRRAAARRIFRLRTISSRRSASIAPNSRSCTSVTTITGCAMPDLPRPEWRLLCHGPMSRPRRRRRAPYDAAAGSLRRLGAGVGVVLAQEVADRRDEVRGLERLGDVHL